MTQQPDLPAVSELVPHAPPMLLLRRLDAWTLDEATCTACVPGDHPLVRGGRVPALVGLELMAQCTAAYLGMLARDHRLPPSGGLLAGAPELTLDAESFVADRPVRVRVERVWGHGQIWRFSGDVFAGERRVVVGTLDVIRTAADGDA